MARAALLKKLFLSIYENNNEDIKKVSDTIIDEERRIGHRQLADELQEIVELQSTFSQKSAVNTNFNVKKNFTTNYLHLLPKDKDSNIPLVDIQTENILLDDIILEGDLKKVILKNLDENMRKDVLMSHGLHPNNRLLFCGPPGCGKTITAKAIANELNLPLVYTRFDSIVSSFLGETAANIRKVFDFIDRGDWVLFFDEFDAVAKERDNPYEHGELKRVVNSFLQLLDNYHGSSLIIAATNHQNILDSAIWRRFDEVIKFNKPSVGEIVNLMKLNLKRFPYDKNIDFKKIALQLHGLSHADIERVCINAIKSAILSNLKSVTNDGLMEEIRSFKVRNQIYSEEK